MRRTAEGSELNFLQQLRTSEKRIQDRESPYPVVNKFTEHANYVDPKNRVESDMVVHSERDDSAIAIHELADDTAQQPISLNYGAMQRTRNLGHLEASQNAAHSQLDLALQETP